MVDSGGWQVPGYRRLLGAPGAADGNVSYVLTEHRMFRDVYKRIDAEWRNNMDRLRKVDHGKTSSGDIAESLANEAQVGKIKVLT